jgi:hypothetical protein
MIVFDFHRHRDKDGRVWHWFHIYNPHSPREPLAMRGPVFTSKRFWNFSDLEAAVNERPEHCHATLLNYREGGRK